MRLYSVFFLSLSLAACGGHDHDDHGGHAEGEVEWCLHMEEGPTTAVTVAGAAGDAVTADHEHKRLEVATTADGGFVRVALDEAGDYIVALSADVSLEVQDGAGAVIALEASEASPEECDAAAVAHTVELGIGEHLLKLGSVQGAPLHVVIEHAEGHDEHDGGHDEH